MIRVDRVDVAEFRCFVSKSFRLGRMVTAIAGHNATGKSTLLGLLGHCAELKMKEGRPILQKQFRTEFSEIIKASRTFDRTTRHVYTVHMVDDDGNSLEPLSFRTTWQKGERFRIIPKRTQTRNTWRKLAWPTLYLGLSRLYPSVSLNKQRPRTAP